MTTNELSRLIRNVPDFPIKGIQFKDITTAFKDKEALKWMCDQIVSKYSNKEITHVVGLESRGFILAPCLAMQLGAGFVPVRKPGKLPAETFREEYTKEYGKDTIEIHKDALSKDDVVLIHDDLLATGGTMGAAIRMIKKIGVKQIYVNFIVELDDLGGREALDKDVEITSLIHF